MVKSAKAKKALRAFFFKTLERESGNEGDSTEKANSIRLIKPFWLLNLDQIDGIEKPRAAAPRSEFQQVDAAEQVLIHSGAVIHEAGENAFYRPSTDEIYLPERTRFASEIEFYSVALHELTHWTGGRHRLARDFAKRFGTEAHAFEELIAELGSAFLNAELGFSAATIPNHAGYIESWLKVLKNDKRAIFTAASQASKAHRYIMDMGGGNTRAEGGIRQIFIETAAAVSMENTEMHFRISGCEKTGHAVTRKRSRSRETFD